jgi:hypothetical protein
MRRWAAYLPAAGLCWLMLGAPLPPAAAEAPSALTQFNREHPDWHIGGFVDSVYIVDFNFPDNHDFRSRTTARKVNQYALNMAQAYVRKDISSQSPWGMEFGVQAGYDANEFAFLQGEPNVGGSDTLKHFSRANVSYLAPIGRGLTVTAGLFNSLIGYESLYARENPNYTRSWIADNTPYMMFGVKGLYPVRDDLQLTLYAINGYYHLSHPNNSPSYGLQAAWKPTSRVSVTQNLYYGPDQASSSLRFWRLFSDTIMEWKQDALTVAVAYDVGTERLDSTPGDPRMFWMGGSLFTRWNVSGPWSVAVRPEFYWDRNGRLTGNEQFVKAVTSTVEYRLPLAQTTSLFRLEYRFDESTGAQGGFFKRGDVSPGVPGLTASQHLLMLSIILAFDS